MQAKETPVTYIGYPDEGTVQQATNRISDIAMAEAFIARHLGDACQAIDDVLEGSSHEVVRAPTSSRTWA